jgi:hypothetical protein
MYLTGISVMVNFKKAGIGGKNHPDDAGAI